MASIQYMSKANQELK